MDLTPTFELVALAAFCWGILAAVMLYAASLDDEGRSVENPDWERDTEALIQATRGFEDVPKLTVIEGEHDGDDS